MMQESGISAENFDSIEEMLSLNISDVADAELERQGAEILLKENHNISDKEMSDYLKASNGKDKREAELEQAKNADALINKPEVIQSTRKDKPGKKFAWIVFERKDDLDRFSIATTKTRKGADDGKGNFLEDLVGCSLNLTASKLVAERIADLDNKVEFAVLQVSERKVSEKCEVTNQLLTRSLLSCLARCRTLPTPPRILWTTWRSGAKR